MKHIRCIMRKSRDGFCNQHACDDFPRLHCETKSRNGFGNQHTCDDFPKLHYETNSRIGFDNQHTCDDFPRLHCEKHREMDGFGNQHTCDDFPRLHYEQNSRNGFDDTHYHMGVDIWACQCPGPTQFRRVRRCRRAAETCPPSTNSTSAGTSERS